MTFTGFDLPKQNYSKLPHALIDHLPDFESMAELKVVLYVIRHTWGFQEFGVPKKITTDEFVKGRKKRDGTRIDAGTGLSENSVRSGLNSAVEHGFMLVETDEKDAARIEKRYSMNMLPSANVEGLGAEVEGLGATFAHRTEKETKVKKQKKEKTTPLVKPDKPPSASKLIQDAMETHFKIILTLSWSSSLAWLKWAVDEVHMTPAQIEYAAEKWSTDSALNWKGQRTPGLKAIQEEWLRTMEGFGDAPITPDDQSDIDWHFGG